MSGATDTRPALRSGFAIAVAMAAIRQCPKVTLCLIVDGTGDDGPFEDYATAVARWPDTPIADESLGTPMLYSSGTTGRPKGILRPLPENPASQPLPLFDFLVRLWRYRDGMIYLSPAPLYHSAPQANVALAIRNGGTPSARPVSINIGIADSSRSLRAP